MEDTDPVKIPYQELSQEALDGIIDSFVLREGTDYGVETTLAAKRAQVRAQLERGEAELCFDPDSETIDIRPVS